MKRLRQYIRKLIQEEYKVRGYIKPAAAFHTLQEWEMIVKTLLKYQEKHIDTRSGEIPNDIFPIISKYFGFIIWSLLTKRLIGASLHHKEGIILKGRNVKLRSKLKQKGEKQ